jgi:alkanesulfonate monooxygenase SsuD/methylene tetrahydromethanopterin reductase-like flavin-dependent oxidoreductase (luciferase family)
LTHCVTIRLGLQIPNFSYDTPVTELFPAVKAQAQEAEAAGFDTVLLMDHKLDVLKQRCDEAGRDPSTLETSTLLTVVLDGYDTRRDIAEATGGRAVHGTAEQVAERIKTNVLDVGVDGVIVNLPTHGYTPGVITKVGEALRPLIA